jgi:L-histidine N-alpha-methyltransferase
LNAPAASERLQLITVETDRVRDEFADAVRAGLTASPKTLPCRFFYDARGSRLFEEICELPEYYPTRTELEILTACADELASMFPGRTSLVELGSGSSSKTRVLIEAFLRRHRRLRYMPVDISRTMLEQSARSLLDEYPSLEVVAIAAEYDHGLRRIRTQEAPCKLILWLGSSIGNFERDEAIAFLRRTRTSMAPADRLLVGMDLKKDKSTLERAYDDRAGVTGLFNKNLLLRINRELGGAFDAARFRHEARWNETHGRVEMHLVSRQQQRVTIRDLDLEVRFDEGESIHTESSHKYGPKEIEEIVEAAGLRLQRRWYDSARRFSVNLLGTDVSGA